MGSGTLTNAESGWVICQSCWSPTPTMRDGARWRWRWLRLSDSSGSRRLMDQKKSVSCVLVADAKGSLKCYHFSMQKMMFAFRVTLELVRIRKKDKSEFTYRVNPCLNKTTSHWSAI